MDAHRVEEILEAGGLDSAAGDGLRVAGRDPILATPFRAGEVAAVALGLSGIAAAELWRRRTGEVQRVAVDVRRAAASLLGFFVQRVSGREDLLRRQPPTIGLYRGGDGRWIHLHGGFPHLHAGLCAILGCEETAEPDEIARAVRRWSALELEDAAAEHGLCATVVRSVDEWNAHPQGRAIAPLPAVEIERIGDAPPRAVGSGTAGEAPASGVRVLDLTRVLAGPACARTLGSYGAEILRIGAASRPFIEPFVIDTGPGKRNAFIDLDASGGSEQLWRLVEGADVFSQGYRLGALAKRGFGPPELARRRPGIVCVSIDCFGHVGPWATRAGWEQLAQSAVGIAERQAAEAGPQLIAAAALDYTTGYLGAYGALHALARRADEGGSWHVKVSLCQTGMWLTRLGATEDPSAAAGLGNLEPFMTRSETAWGTLAHLAPAVELSVTPARWRRPPAPLGSHPPAWS